MSARGVFAVDRDIWKDPDFADEPLTEREAFLWLVSEAAWRTHKTRGAHGSVQIDRGEFCHSVRFMAAAWQWSKSRVDRFLKKLCDREIIVDQSRDNEKVYLVRNYNEFQRVGTQERDTIGTAAGHDRDKLETGKHLNKEDLSPKPVKPVRGRHSYSDEFEAFWRDYPTDPNMSKLDAWKVWIKLSDDDRRLAMAAVPKFIDYCRKHPDYRVVYADRFLSKRRFDGYAEQIKAQAQPPDPRIDFGEGYSAPLSTVRAVVERGRGWPPHWGPKLDEPGCRVPRELWSQILPKKSLADHSMQGELLH